MYSIVLLTYNEENYVFRALESIRYQIETYGSDRQFQLIIADDCSKDDTRGRMEYWLSEYGHIITKTDRSYQEVNVGTCRNLSDALRLVEGECLYIMGGDDLFSTVDAFGEISKAGNFDILANMRLVAEDDKLSKKKSIYVDALAQVYYTANYVSWSVGLGCPGQVGMTWNVKHNTERMFGWMERYRLMEDRARYYAICHFEGPIEYKLCRKPIIIYCRNKTSVSSFAGRHVDSIRNDLMKFYQDVYDNSGSGLYRFEVWCQKQSAKLRGKGWLSVLRYLTPYYFIEQGKRIIHRKEMNRAFDELMSEYFDSNDKHLQRMNGLSSKLTETYFKQTGI